MTTSCELPAPLSVEAAASSSVQVFNSMIPADALPVSVPWGVVVVVGVRCAIKKF